MNTAVLRDDLDDLRAALNSRAAELAVSLLGEPNRALSNKHQLRYGRKGSLAVTIAGAKPGTWFDHEAGEGGGLLDLVMRERGRGFADALEFARDFVGSAIARPRPAPRAAVNHKHVDEPSNTAQFAARIWHESIDPRGTPAEVYLNSRSLEMPDRVAGNAIRFHPPFRYVGRTAAAMVALFRDITTNKAAAISATFLNPFAEKIERCFFGPTKGAAIKLDADENITEGLHIGEGIETCIAAMLAGYRPCWAVGSAGSIASFPVVPGIEALTLLGEINDGGANARAVEACAARWLEAGIEVYLIGPLTGDDMNAVWREAILQ